MVIVNRAPAEGYQIHQARSVRHTRAAATGA
jgi:hypothetical protein